MLEKVVGQDRAKQVLELLGHSFRQRGKIPPIGIFGGTGLGKTHIISCWTEEIGAHLLYINGTSVKSPIAFRAFFKDARNTPSKHHVVFVDECHGLPRLVQENLLSVLEEPAILCTTATQDVGHVRCVEGMRYISKGDVMREELPSNLSFVFATTDPARLKSTILNRLRKIKLSPYTIDDKIEVAITHLGEYGFRSDIAIYESLANRCRSIRHLKKELCETFWDIRTLHGGDDDDTLDMLDDILGIDEDGANDQDRDYLEYLAENTTVGLETMAGKLQVEKQEILKTVEPFLLSKGWITIVSRGRRLTDSGCKKVFGDDYAGTSD
jgi:Holliday junction DNA helicase RuvB